MTRRPYRCRQCGYTWHTHNLFPACPDCGSHMIESWERMAAVKAEE